MRKLFLTITIFVLTNTIDAQIPTDSLQLNYSFNNNPNDLSGNNFHGTLSNPTLTTDRFLNVNNSYTFNGSSDFISVPNNNLIKPDFPFSISLWVKIDSFSSTASIIYASDDTSGIYSGFWIGYLPSGQISAGYGDGLGIGSNHRVTKHSLTTSYTGYWYNIIAVFNGLNDIDLYINCEEDSGYYSGSASNMTNLGSNGSVGKRIGSYHNGKIDDIRVYNKSLNAFEIDSLCTESNPILGISESINSSFLNISPNPTTGLINVNIENYPSAYSVRILNSNGQKIIEKKLNHDRGTIDLQDLSSGIYYVLIIDLNGVSIGSKKVILK